MKFEILNRWSGKVQVEAEIECEADAARGIKIGLAVRWALNNGAVLSGADLRRADLRRADLRDADLSGADLSGADLSDAVLSGAVLSGADLRRAVLRGAGLSGGSLAGVPRIPDIHRAVYDAARQPGALDMSTWHCGTTHCRAGWVVTLAGDGGRALEWALGTAAAAAIIYVASDPQIERIPDFYATNEAALEDMRRLATAATGASKQGST